MSPTFILTLCFLFQLSDLFILRGRIEVFYTLQYGFLGALLFVAFYVFSLYFSFSWFNILLSIGELEYFVNFNTASLIFYAILLFFRLSGFLDQI